ncbi:MAG: SigB/SigF/SigG family RNA polymerase sigma factor [Clostridia bacterium]|jgi:RNA polymerase sporulation-specific sigma factor|nr:SigB/SigF/SigG family RNA polymerase sigma factor [Clostridia bacterium]MDD3231923.1 SigB/SigF/SigG family RNA polymerase sigma factor [Clostridia bacterium]MDD3862302.1 SigB/SigF/SigG family RNA polymerase sigma factor [Clostridia bacterium]
MLEYNETIKLIKQAQNGDEKAKTILIEQNAPLVKSVIKKFRNKNLEYDDLYQLGCVGFLKAINNFDTSFNVRFSTYVVPMIIGEIKRFLRDDGMIKVSRTIKTQNRLISKFIQNFQNKNAKKPTLHEISEEFQIEEEEIVFIMDSSKMPISIYTPYENEENGLLLIDRYIQNYDNEIVFDKLLLKEALNTLDERSKKIVLLRFFRDKTQNEIAQELNISQVQVSRLENRILGIIKEKLKVSEN